MILLEGMVRVVDSLSSSIRALVGILSVRVQDILSHSFSSNMDRAVDRLSSLSSSRRVVGVSWVWIVMLLWTRRDMKGDYVF